jgi:hypothetical protein
LSASKPNDSTGAGADGEAETAWSRVVEAAPAPAGWRPAATRLGGLEVRPRPGLVVGLPESRTGESNRREEESMNTEDGSGDLTPMTRFAANWERWTGTVALTGHLERVPVFYTAPVTIGGDIGPPRQ